MNFKRYSDPVSGRFDLEFANRARWEARAAQTEGQREPRLDTREAFDTALALLEYRSPHRPLFWPSVAIRFWDERAFVERARRSAAHPQCCFAAATGRRAPAGNRL